jgi:tape measure domain-containing protein
MPLTATQAASLYVHVGADTKDLERGLDRGEKKTRSFASTLGSIGKVAALGAVAGVAAIGGLGAVVGKVGFDFNSLQQQSQIAFETILGDAGKAKSFMADLSGFAAKTPFELGPLTQYASRLAAVGVETSRIIPLMTRLGDATSLMGTGSEGINRAVTALTQMQQKGKVTGEEMLQLVEAGIPAWDALAAKIGVDVPKAQEMASKGQIKVNELFAALEEGAGPAMARLAGGMEKQSQSFSGLISTAKDSFAQFSGAIMGPVFEMATKGLGGLTTAMASPAFLEFGQRLGAGIGGAVAAIISGGGRVLGLIEKLGDEIGFLLGIDPGAFASGWGTWGAVIGQVAGQIAGFVTGTILPALGQLASFVTGQVAPALRDFIGGDVLPKVQELGAILSGTLVPAFASLAQTAVSVLVPALQQTIGFLADNKEILGGVAIAIGTVLVGAFAAWALSAGAAAVATIAATAPLIAIGVVIAALATGIILLVKHWDDITERFPLLGTVADEVAASARHLADFVTGTLVPGLMTVVDTIREHWGTISAVAEGVWNAVRTAVEGAIQAVTLVITTEIVIVRGLWETFGGDLQTIISGAWTAISGIVEGGVTVIRGIITTAIALWTGDWQGVWDGMRTILSGALTAYEGLISGAMQIIQGLLSAGLHAIQGLWTLGWEALKTALGLAWEGIKAGVQTGISNLETEMRALPGRIVGALGDLGGLLFSAGADLIRGMIAGVRSMAARLVEEALSVVGDAKDAVLKKFGIGSPSEVFAAEVGEPIAAGIALGIRESAAGVRDAAAGLGDASLTALADAIEAHSWSRRFFRLGADGGEGYTLGVMSKVPQAQAAGEAISVATEHGVVRAWNVEEAMASGLLAYTDWLMNEGAKAGLAAATVVGDAIEHGVVRAWDVGEAQRSGLLAYTDWLMNEGAKAGHAAAIIAGDSIGEGLAIGTRRSMISGWEAAATAAAPLLTEPAKRVMVSGWETAAIAAAPLMVEAPRRIMVSGWERAAIAAQPALVAAAVATGTVVGEALGASLTQRIDETYQEWVARLEADWKERLAGFAQQAAAAAPRAAAAVTNPGNIVAGGGGAGGDRWIEVSPGRYVNLGPVSGAVAALFPGANELQPGMRRSPGEFPFYPSYQHGTPYVPETGLYRLHRGEAVVPAGRGGGGPVTVNVTVPITFAGRVTTTQGAFEEEVAGAVRGALERGSLVRAIAVALGEGARRR